MEYTLEQLYEMQKALDARIIREKGLEGQDLLPNTVLALQVELGELANEWRGFKHWSNDREPRYTKKSIGFADPGGAFEYETHPLLEEYVDCLHFILSIGLQLEPNIIQEWQLPAEFERFEYSDSITEYFNLLFGAWNGIDNLDGSGQYDQYFWNFAVFVELGKMLGFTWEQIAEAYVTKNKTNHARQSNGY